MHDIQPWKCPQQPRMNHAGGGLDNKMMSHEGGGLGNRQQDDEPVHTCMHAQKYVHTNSAITTRCSSPVGGMLFGVSGLLLVMRAGA